MNVSSRRKFQADSFLSFYSRCVSRFRCANQWIDPKSSRDAQSIQPYYLPFAVLYVSSSSSQIPLLINSSPSTQILSRVPFPKDDRAFSRSVGFKVKDLFLPRNLKSAAISVDVDLEKSFLLLGRLAMFVKER
jgi:hypothetical protein